MELGYASINLTLGKDVKVNRGMIKRTFKSKGINYAGELAFKNILDLEKIIKWNIKNNILVYRMSSDMFPWMSEYNIHEIPNFNQIKNKLIEIGNICKCEGHRVSFHPGPFNCLASPTENVVNKTIKELNQHSEIMDIMGFEANHNTKINIHIGGSYKDKEKTAKRFNENFYKLDKNTQKRLTIENDDKLNLYTVKELYDLIYKKIKIPIVFDYHHHLLNSGNLSEEKALYLAISTWNGIKPTFHYSSSKKIYENNDNTKIKKQSHADYIYNKINTYGKNFCIILESKAKDLSVLKYKKDYCY
ncbi:MAG: UV DNA damage repair endonuclease UvsE [archaeon]